MSRIATLTAVLATAVAIAAAAGPAAASHANYVERAAVAQTDLRSPDAATPVQFVSQQDLRSPDAAAPVVAAGHSSVAQTASHDGSLSSWALIAVIAAAFAAIGLLVVLLRRRLDVGRPLGI